MKSILAIIIVLGVGALCKPKVFVKQKVNVAEKVHFEVIALNRNLVVPLILSSYELLDDDTSISFFALPESYKGFISVQADRLIGKLTYTPSIFGTLEPRVGTKTVDLLRHSLHPT